MTLRALWPLTQQFQAKNGSILVSGKVYIYYQGRTALATTYHDEEGTVVNANPVILDNNGRATVFADTIYSYTIVVCDYYGKELFSQDITLHDAILSAKNVIVMGSNGSVKVDTTTLPNGVKYDLSVNTDIIATKKSVDDVKTDLNNLTEVVNGHTTEISQIKDDVAGIESAISNKKDKQQLKSFKGSATKTVKNISQDENGELNVEFEDIDLPQEVPNVEITSEDSSVNITASVDAETNTKTFDLSVNIEDAPTFGRFVANNGLILTKTEGNMTLSSDGKIQLKKGKGYHFTIRGNYYNDKLYNDLLDINFIEYSRNETIPIIVDGTLATSQAQPFEISFDVAQRTSDLNYGIAFSGLTSNGHISGLRVEVHDINSVSVNGGSSGDNDKVAVDANAEPGYLENVLVSDSDIVSLVKLGNVLHVQVNTASTADPKLYTCDEAVINGATNNYGSYALANGYDKLVWDDPSSYAWLNASVIQMKRLCTSQGTVTKCNVALSGSLSLTSPPAFINCGIFNTDGKLLGSTGLRLYGTDFFSGSELVSFDMSEVNTGDLNLKNNTYYIIQIITCGLQLASLSHKDSYNYAYDYDLRMNIEGTTSKAAWSNINDLTTRAAQIPWISFAASPSI
ncbi:MULTISPECIES: hypothetical protein [Bacteria]|uniref:hypothetical protein n=1 Tax=Bacteria TaxID=2 RepID=UPI000A9DE43C|nr:MULTISPECIES: hypothetical protein [Bacteria]